MNNINEIKELITKIPNDEVILLAGHENTDYDSIGSTLALTRFLNKIGKKAFMLLEEKEMFKLDWFNNTEYILTEYDDNNYIFIQLDSNRKARLGVYEEYFDKAKLKINIDHHENNKMEADYIVSIPEISATSEIIYNLINLFDIPMSKETASLLYGGIVSDTYCFYQRVTPKTYRAVADLLSYDIDSQYIIKSVYADRTLKELEVLTHMINNFKYDKFHYIVLNKEDYIMKDVDYNTIYKKNIPVVRDIKEIEILCILLIDGDKIHGEFRSNCKMDVDELATILGGGGHKKASGFVTKKTTDEIIEIVKDYIHINKLV